MATPKATGTWKPGSPIPNEQDLARELGVSAGTMRKALDLLETERVVTRRQGRGTYVNDPASEELAARFNNFRDANGKRIVGVAKTLDIAEVPATELERERLQLSTGASVYRLHRTRSHLDQIFMVEDTSLPAALFPGLLQKEPNQLDDVTILARGYGILLHDSQERVSMTSPPAAVASVLGVAPGAEVMHLDRIIYMLGDHRPIEWRVAYCRLTNGSYVVEIH